MPDIVHDRLRRLLLDDLGADVPSIDTDLFETAILDSLQFVQLLSLLEQHFGVRFSTADLEIDNFRSIASIANFIDRLRRRSAASAVDASSRTEASAQQS